MEDLIQQARTYATQAHKRIDQRRKYTRQAYDVHLHAVATMVASVCDDPLTIAAAWLHDVVEDTPATFHDVEREFGSQLAALVAELTDVSRPSDGNRSTRKEIDRRHLAQASARAKTVKLADLIDNARDIVRHDPRFGRTFLVEMAELLEVLREGDARLLERAEAVVSEGAAQLGISLPAGLPGGLDSESTRGDPVFVEGRVRRLFANAFSARDVAEPLRSFDVERAADDVAARMDAQGLGVAGVRRDGEVGGYVRRGDPSEGTLVRRARAFARGQVVDGDASLSEVISVLTRHEYCFVALLGSVAGVVTRAEIQGPLVRMWLFGMIMLIEMRLAERVAAVFPGESWVERVAPARLVKARSLAEERARRGQGCDLFDCLQLSDKAGVLLSDAGELATLGFESRKAARRVVKELESLRNNLAHGQDIVSHDWAQIARMTASIERLDAEH